MPVQRMMPPSLTIASYITIARLMLALISFVLMIRDQWSAAFPLIFVAIILDMVDGKVARQWRQVSTQGVFLDIMADKITIISAFFIIGLKIDILFFYLGLFMLAREYAMDTMRAIAASHGIVIPADRFSKIKGVLFMTAILLMIGSHAFSFSAPIDHGLQQTGIIMAITGMLLAYYTMIRFLMMHKQSIAS